MLTIEAARKAVRRTSQEFDEELLALMEAAKQDMRIAGVLEQHDNALYDSAVRMYLRGNFEPSAPGAESCRMIYEDLKSAMHLSYAYTEAQDERAY